MSDISAQPVMASNVDTYESDTTQLLTRVGRLTRELHDNLRTLGLDKIIDKVANDMPDARDRLDYVARMTEQAAIRVLNATDIAMPLQDDLAEKTKLLESQWHDLLNKASLKSEYNQMASQTIDYLTMTQLNTSKSKDILLEIMMAQDFQDLTGQVIKRITALASDIERQLVQVLIDYAPIVIHGNEGDVSKENAGEKLAPTPKQGVADGVSLGETSSQSEVDDLLDSLGF
jgi:chemotaxis protein CheZ